MHGVVCGRPSAVLALNIGLSQASNVKTDHAGLIGNIANQCVRQPIAGHVVQE